MRTNRTTGRRSRVRQSTDDLLLAVIVFDVFRSTRPERDKMLPCADICLPSFLVMYAWNVANSCQRGADDYNTCPGELVFASRQVLRKHLRRRLRGQRV